MELFKKEKIKDFFNNFYNSYIPNKKDSKKQIVMKSLFIVAIITLLISVIYLANYLLDAANQNSIVEDSRDIWHSMSSETESTTDKTEDENTTEDKEIVFPEPIETLLAQNGDFKGWITINGTKVDNPIYQTDNNDFYLNHNQQKKKSAYGALYFDCNNTITADRTDKNLVIYGHRMKNGTMFGTLKKFRALDFYKQYPTIEFSTLYETGTYKIYSIFVLNANPSDDNGEIYNIYRDTFEDEDDFSKWANEAYTRSLIYTGVDVALGDDIITLVTCCSDIDNARLVITARKTREGEDPTVDTENAMMNPNPKYPARWYKNRGIKYPFE